jgi:hypothetical protein
MHLYGVQFLLILKHSILHSLNDIKSHIDDKSFVFDTFQLLEKYYNNLGLDLDMNLVTDFKKIRFMVILTTHITNTTKKIT